MKGDRVMVEIKKSLKELKSNIAEVDKQLEREG